MDISNISDLLDKSDNKIDIGSLIDPQTIIEPMLPFIYAMVGISIVMVVLYAFSLVDKWRANRAIININKLLIEMAARDEVRGPKLTSQDDKPKG